MILRRPAGGLEEKRPVRSSSFAQVGWIENATPPESTGAWGGAETRAKREALVSKDPARIAEALNLVATAPDERAWGTSSKARTCPDVFLTTNDTVVVIEGTACTEKGPTTITSWMSVRHQILRHIDSALEVASTRRVIGFFVVEGDGAVVPLTGAKPPSIRFHPTRWRSACLTDRTMNGGKSPKASSGVTPGQPPSGPFTILREALI